MMNEGGPSAIRATMNDALIKAMKNVESVSIDT